jgi:hypothetical protein
VVVDRLVQLAQEGGTSSSRGPVAVRDPFALSGVVEVKHQAGVDAQAVGVERPATDRRSREEARDLVAAIVEDVALPVGMEPLARIGMLVR